MPEWRGLVPRMTMSPPFSGGRATPGRFWMTLSASPVVPGMRWISWSERVVWLTSFLSRAPRTTVS